jgi:hypothetical protein
MHLFRFSNFEWHDCRDGGTQVRALKVPNRQPTCLGYGRAEPHARANLEAVLLLRSDLHGLRRCPQCGIEPSLPAKHRGCLKIPPMRTGTWRSICDATHDRRTWGPAIEGPPCISCCRSFRGMAGLLDNDPLPRACSGALRRSTLTLFIARQDPS